MALTKQIILLTFIALQANAQHFLNGSIYCDSRGFNTMTVEGQSEIGRWQTFAFVDFYTDKTNSSNFTSAYGEIKEAVKIFGPYRLLYEYNDGNGKAVHRLGLQIDLKGFWIKKIRILPYTYSKPSGQISAVFYWSNSKLTLKGFSDFNFNYQTKKSNYITEILIGYRMLKKINLVIEIELNNFTNQKTGIAPGIEIIF